MRVFVTGGSGFVGRNLIEALVARGDMVNALARSASSAKIVQELGATPIHGELNDESALREGILGCDTVVHLAATVSDWGDPEAFHRVNVIGTEQVLFASHELDVQTFIHISTEAVLAGGKPIINADETTPRPTNPVGLYPLTKGLAEDVVLGFESGPMKRIILRPRFVWGKGDTVLLPNLIQRVEKGQFLWIHGGHHLTSTCHVKNLCEGILLAIDKGKDGEIYFLTDGDPVTVRSMFTQLMKTQGIDLKARSVSRWLAWTGARLAELIWRRFNLDGGPPLTKTAVNLIGNEVTVNDAKARRELDYEGKVSIEQGLAEMAK